MIYANKQSSGRNRCNSIILRFLYNMLSLDVKRSKSHNIIDLLRYDGDRVNAFFVRISNLSKEY